MSRFRVLVASLAVLSACSVSPRSRIPDVANLYAEAALDEIRNPVVVIHGILGARLEQRSTGKVVWGAFTSDGVDPGEPDGARAIALPLDAQPAAAAYDPDTEDVAATGPLDRLELSLLYNVVSVDVYAAIIRALGVAGYRDRVASDRLSPRYADDHYTCFTFFYDWRQDNVANAIQLGRFLESARAEVERTAGARAAALRGQGTGPALERAQQIQDWLDRGIRFDVVAHSMGGLIARYYLRYGARDLPADGTLPEVTWAGAGDIDRLVLVGTPNLGAMEALQQLQEGYQASFLLPFFDPVVIGSMPSVYQLLPRPRHRLVVDGLGDPRDVDFLDPGVWIENGWGMLAPRWAETLAWLLPDVDDAAERRRIAERHVDRMLERARRFHAALDVLPATSAPSHVSLFAGDVQPTVHRVRVVTGGDGRLRTVFGLQGLAAVGDGTVARYSAIADEREGDARKGRLVTPVPWSRVTFVADDHLGLTSNPTFVDNLLFELMEMPLPLRERTSTR